MKNIFRHASRTPLSESDSKHLNETEWLVTNGLGGYASGTIGGSLTRVFHGYLIAALPSPLGRTVMLNDILEQVALPDGRIIPLNGLQKADDKGFAASEYLTHFGLELGLPVWTYEIEGVTLEKRLLLPHGQNTTYVNYRISAGSASWKLQLRPAVNMRAHETPVNTPVETYSFTVRDHQYELFKSSNDLPPLRIMIMAEHAGLAVECACIRDVVYAVERSRGYIWKGDLWSPGFFTAEIAPGREANLIASTENWDVMSALSPAQAWDAEHDRRRRLLMEAFPGAGGETRDELIWAANQFVIAPVGRQEDTARARAAGDEIRTVIAGYHWFTDWGRDTMISLEGLTLTTGRQVEASYILRTFAHYIRHGLIPNMFPEGKKEGLYHTADATLWFFHALHRYVENTGDLHLLKQLESHLLDIVGHHLRGTLFNIHVDHSDALLVQGQEGYQLTWMDAKVGDWVVTPRRGKAVEINALWYNALRLLEGWLRDGGRTDEANGLAEHADRAKASFNEKFWYADGGYLYDVIEGESGGRDPACRPNQLFAISLEHPVLNEDRWESVLQVAKKKLLTPVGLRSLAPGDKEFKARYDGDLRARDAAYHQGTVWAWLIGPFIDAWLKVYPEDLETARGFLDGFKEHLHSACVGSISEIFDAEPPFTPRGCCAQAWSVAEVLRCYAKTSGLPEGIEEKPELTSLVASS
ncbi:MAG: glycogen debranching enzyme N-terminal domain-containing protein [Acidobacteriaceae bacterium]|nr:glycogen debranching enzyme N-terminal domain-containing protein [Acidobacteriaceae bacterium]MBV9779554.1 glycogen debranching enzyme N-terminal domain-containing protein [Acidobacteriaceae bacterium]